MADRNEFIARAAELFARQCERQNMDLRAKLYRNGSNDEQPEVVAFARVLRNIKPRPLHELLAEED